MVYTLFIDRKISVNQLYNKGGKYVDEFYNR